MAFPTREASQKQPTHLNAADASSDKGRLDVALVERGLVPSRAKAQALILAGRITVNGQPLTKVGHRVATDDKLEVVPGARFVSRGGEKLDGALEDFRLDSAGRVCLDVGASTGGFTDCLLQRGAARVYAIDVGRAQFDAALKADPRVVSMEETHILELAPGRLPEKPDFAVVDVSFISLRKVLAKVYDLLAPEAVAVTLVKPQFEVGPRFLKKGVVRSEAVRAAAVNELAQAAQEAGFAVKGRTLSRLKGPKGNQEEFLYLVKEKK